jgi:glycerol-3-phosphate cytidylyltransferase
MAKIKTEKGNLYFSHKALYLGRKKINKAVAKQNLLDFNAVAKQNNLSFGLLYGTLLGAIRENDFIEHDEDIDLFILDEQRQVLYNLLFKLKEIGFEVARYDRRGLISIIRNNEYIDIYIFKKYIKNVRICCGECVIEKFLEQTTTLNFLTESFTVPKDYLEYLVFQYGRDWQTPIAYSDFKVKKNTIIFCEIKERIKYYLPDFIFYPLIKQNEKQFIDSFFKKVELNSINL